MPRPDFLRIVDESRKLVECIDFIGGIGGDEVEPAFDGVAVGVDESGEKTFAVEIDTFGVGGDRLRDFGESADGDDLVLREWRRLPRRDSAGRAVKIFAW